MNEGEEMVNCNQCGARVSLRTGVGMGFNMGHGPVYVCLQCKPPARAREVIADMNDFFRGAEESKGGQEFSDDLPKTMKTDLNELYESEEAALEPFHDGRKIYSQGDCPRCWDANEELVTVDPVCDDHGEEIGRQCRECNWGYLHSENNQAEPRP